MIGNKRAPIPSLLGWVDAERFDRICRNIRDIRGLRNGQAFIDAAKADARSATLRFSVCLLLIVGVLAYAYL